MVEQSEFEVSPGRRNFCLIWSCPADGSPGATTDVWQASVMFKVPLYFWNKSTGVKAANADLQSARYDYKTAQLSVLARVRELYATAKTSEHHLHLYETGIIPQAPGAPVHPSNYRVGKTDFLTSWTARAFCSSTS